MTGLHPGTHYDCPTCSRLRRMTARHTGPYIPADVLRDPEPLKPVHAKASCELFEDSPDAT